MNKRERILSFVVETAKDISGCDNTVVVDERTRLEFDLGLDSLDGLQLVMACEEEFSVAISDDEARGVERISDLVDVIDKRLEKF